jgi:thioredoxin 1
MASIEKKYSGQVKVTFHDVWKDDAPAKKYGIDLIPTQVFLDASGKELMRHEGFFPEEEIDKFLQTQGVNISQ